MKEVKLDSGAVLKIGLAPFAEAKALFQACMAELRYVEIKKELELADLFKNFFCIGFSSPHVEAALKKCLERSLYNGQKIADELFEPEEARNDYLKVCSEVALANLAPFLRTLFAKFQEAMSMSENFQL